MQSRKHAVNSRLLHVFWRNLRRKTSFSSTELFDVVYALDYTFFYKNTLYKNTRLRLLKRLRTIEEQYQAGSKVSKNGIEELMSK